jgi:hypothetical protein
MSESTKNRLCLIAALALFLVASHMDYVWMVPQ